LKIAIRTDSSLLIGAGHVMRCKTLAEELRRRGAEVLFVCRDHPGNLIPLLKEDGYSVTALLCPNSMIIVAPDQSDNYAAWLGVEQQEDAEQTIEALGDFQPDWLIVDHYGIGSKWESKIRPYVGSILVIDDLAYRMHDCDVLLNQDIFDISECSTYQTFPVNTKFLLGPKFALLRPQFRRMRQEAFRKRCVAQPSRVNIFMGGVDQENQTAKVLTGIINSPLRDLKIDVVLGPTNPHIRNIQEICKLFPHVQLYVRIREMANLMAHADLAIGGAGGASYERCCLGLPTILISMSENQIPLAKSLQSRNAAFYLGHFKDISPSDIGKAFECIVSKPVQISAMARNASNLCDGLGVQRVAKKILDGH
jgi:UDP-2,4-diacetamido-2,4,6-trideoxy-beta-L-altropyranose hydrolase